MHVNLASGRSLYMIYLSLYPMGATFPMMLIMLNVSESVKHDISSFRDVPQLLRHTHTYSLRLVSHRTVSIFAYPTLCIIVSRLHSLSKATRSISSFAYPRHQPLVHYTSALRANRKREFSSLRMTPSYGLCARLARICSRIHLTLDLHFPPLICTTLRSLDQCTSSLRSAGV